MPEQKHYHAFLGFSPPGGFIEEWRKFQKGKHKPPLRWTPWYKLHLTLLFWPALSRAGFQQLLALAQSECREKSLRWPQSNIEGFHFFLRPQVLYLRENSPAVFEFQKSMQVWAETLPAELRPGPERSFVPHWTIGRKFFAGHLQQHTAYFAALDRLRWSGPLPSLSLWLSDGGRYEPHSLDF